MRRVVLLTLATASLLASTSASPAQAATDPPGPLCPRGVSADERLDASQLKGMKLWKARRLAGRYECEVRVVKLDGEWLDVTTDLVRDRINVVVRDRRIRKVLNVA